MKSTSYNFATNPGPNSDKGWGVDSWLTREFVEHDGRQAVEYTRVAIKGGYGVNTREAGIAEEAGGHTEAAIQSILPTVLPGQLMRGLVDIACSAIGARVAMDLHFYDDTGALQLVVSGTPQIADGTWQHFTIEGVAPALATRCSMGIFTTQIPADEPLNTKTWMSRVMYSHKELEYFDGSSPDDTSPGDLQTYAHHWAGEVGASVSVKSRTRVSPWTQRWWDSLPSAYKLMDGQQPAGGGYYPLLRFLDGFGSLAGQIRELSDAGWNGDLTNVAIAPEASLRWLGQVMGLPPAQRALPATELRAILVSMADSGRPAIGTRRSISDAARRFLTGNKQVTVVPSATTPHTIVILVVNKEVPGGGLARLVANVRAAGVVPAGHNLIAVAAQATWDSWIAAAGTTWDEVDAKARTWAQADSLGVVLDENL